MNDIQWNKYIMIASVSLSQKVYKYCLVWILDESTRIVKINVQLYRVSKKLFSSPKWRRNLKNHAICSCLYFGCPSYIIHIHYMYTVSIRQTLLLQWNGFSSGHVSWGLGSAQWSKDMSSTATPASKAWSLSFANTN